MGKELAKNLPPRLLREKAEALDEKNKTKASNHFQSPKQQLEQNPLWINDNLKQICQNFNMKNNTDNQKSSSAFKKPIPQNFQTKLFTPKSSPSPTHLLIDKLSTINCSKTDDLGAADESLVDSSDFKCKSPVCSFLVNSIDKNNGMCDGSPAELCGGEETF